MKAHRCIHCGSPELSYAEDKQEFENRNLLVRCMRCFKQFPANAILAKKKKPGELLRVFVVLLITMLIACYFLTR